MTYELLTADPREGETAQSYAFIINSLIGGGAERIMTRLLTHSADYNDGCALHLILLDVEPSAYEVPDFVTVHQLDTRGSLVAGLLGVWKLLRAIGPQACLSFLTRSNVIAVIITRMLGIRCVISERVHSSSHHGDSLSGRLGKLLTWLFYRHADAVITVSDDIATDLSNNYGVPRQKLITIPNPVDEETTRAMGAAKHDLTFDKPLIVGMGRLVPNKNFALLIEAFALAELEGTLVIMGDGPLRGELEKQIETLALQGRVRLIGFQSNPFPIISDADCYVLPSNGEGFPNGLVEAMILETPVISTNCHSGPSDILADRSYFPIEGVYEAEYGILVPPNDASAMAAALQKVTAEGQYEKWSTQARNGARRYQLAPTVGKYWSVMPPTDSRASIKARRQLQ